jgi:hypothetical protein
MGEFIRGSFEVVGVVFERRRHVEKAGPRRRCYHALGVGPQLLGAPPPIHRSVEKGDHTTGTDHRRAGSRKSVRYRANSPSSPRAARLAEMLGEAIGLLRCFECSAKEDAEVEHVEHDQFAWLDPLFRQPAPHLREMRGNGQSSVARDDDRLQCAAPGTYSLGYTDTARLPANYALIFIRGAVMRIMRPKPILPIVT